MRDEDAPARLRVAMACLGIGHVRRGYEASTVDLFEGVAARADLGIDAVLYAGYPHPGAVLPPLWRRIRGLARRLRCPASCTEYLFATTLLLELLRTRPHVVWTKSFHLANLLVRTRRLFGHAPAIVYANGAPTPPDECRRFDYVQQLHPGALEEALRAGLNQSRMEVLPNTVRLPRPARPRSELRAAWGYSESDWVVVCVAAWNRDHKRVDYVIEDVARIEHPSVKLLLCGDPDKDTAHLVELGRRRLGDRVRFTTVPHVEIADVLYAADAFVLGSLVEAFGQAILEARAAGLPIVVHPHGGSRFILEDEPDSLVDLRRPGALAGRLRELRSATPDPARLLAAAERAQERFGGEAPIARFAAMLRRATGVGPAPPVPRARVGLWRRLSQRFHLFRWKAFGGPIQLHTREMLFVLDALRSHGPCRFLVFGAGYDSPLWSRLNAGGRTAFLEDDPVWIEATVRAHPLLEVHRVTYTTRLSDWKELLGQPARLSLDLAPSVSNEKWDVILVDGPSGDTTSYRAAFGVDPPGRMSSIYMATKLVAPGGDILVHDCEREVESEYCRRFLADLHPLGRVRRRALLKRFRLCRAPPSEPRAL